MPETVRGAEGATNGGRAVGLVVAVSVAVSAVLVAYHPEGTAHDAAGVLQDLARDRVMDAIVHSGMIVTMGVVTLCFAAFAARLGAGRAAVLAGLVANVIGYVGMAGALMTDGLILPAVAARFVPVEPDTLPIARGILILAGTAIGFLMTFGLAFLSIGVIAWGIALLRDALTRSAGVVGLVVGAVALALAALAALGVIGDSHIVIVILAILMLWNIVVAILLIRRTV